jgi:hypothetical protein
MDRIEVPQCGGPLCALVCYRLRREVSPLSRNHDERVKS